MDEKGATYLCDLLRQSAGGADSAPEAAGRASPPRYLILLRGGIPGTMLLLEPGLRTLGRSSENDLQLPEMSVSRQHAQLAVESEGLVRLTDLGSTNGTFLNGHRLPPQQPATLRDGDRIGFGPTMIVKFTCPDPCEEDYQRQIFERAVRDPLTGLYNRGYFLEQAPVLERQAAGKGLGLAVLMLDVDHFKRINDAHGHDTGDAVLRDVAQMIRQSTRTDDLVARYGGEEFVAALPIATPDQAVERAERIRRNLALRRLSIAGRPLRITASIGLAFAIAGRPASITALISAADAGLYQAKRTGRDRVVFRGELTEQPDPLTTIDYLISDGPSTVGSGQQ